MKNQREDDRLKRWQVEFAEEEARLPVPASPARIVLGIITMLSGFLFGAFAGDSWWALLGIVAMLAGPMIMVRWPKK
jgi:hypothetical protein